MSFSQPQRRFIVRWAHSSDTEAPLLFTSWDDATLDAAVTELARVIVCEDASRSPCGACAGCHALQQQRSSDVVSIAPDAATLSIKDVRRIIHIVSRTSFAHHRLVVVPRAERLYGPAAHAFLKTLEEVRPLTRFVLTTRFPGRLLATVRSRCQRLILRTDTPFVSHLSSETASDVRQLMDSPDFLLRLAVLQRAGEITPDELTVLAAHFERQLREHGPSRSLRAAFSRLRDFYVISQERGGSKLAAEVLVATAAQLGNT